MNSKNSDYFSIVHGVSNTVVNSIKSLSTTMVPTALKKKTPAKRFESLKFVGGSKFMKELQKTVFFAAYDSVVFSSGKSFTDKEQKEMLRCSILGSEDPDDISLPEQMVLGINQFAHLYDDVPMENNTTETPLLHSAGLVLII